MLDIVDLFKERETRDELGLGSVRDTFADLFFPGTSTIMTRARYFLLVPWTYQRLEKQRIRSEEIAARARRAEIDLVEAIERSDDSEANIGKLARSALKRLPSSVYWQGLTTLGIRKFKGAQAQYHRGLDAHYAQVSRQSGRALERDVEHDDLIEPNWHGGLTATPPDFPSECSLSLSSSEAEYLSERIRLSPDSSRSLLALLAAKGKYGSPVPFVWQHPFLADVPANTKEKLDHSQNFSEFMHGAALLYNLILSEQANREESVTTYRHEINAWAERLAQRGKVFADWRCERFWELVREANPRIT